MRTLSAYKKFQGTESSISRAKSLVHPTVVFDRHWDAADSVEGGKFEGEEWEKRSRIERKTRKTRSRSQNAKTGVATQN